MYRFASFAALRPAMETFSVDMDDLLICDGSQIILASSGSSEMSPGEAAEAVTTANKPTASASSGQQATGASTRRPRKTSSSSSDVVTRLVRSRQSAKECRARKKVRRDQKLLARIILGRCIWAYQIGRLEERVD